MELLLSPNNLHNLLIFMRINETLKAELPSICNLWVFQFYMIFIA